MKTLNKRIKRLMALVLPFLFLCSCYEIVYVSQDTDNIPNGILQPDICIQAYNVDEKPVTPYIGFLVHESWSVNNGFVYSKSFNGYSVKLGSFKYSELLSSNMEKLDPAPNGYHWWVAFGSTAISESGAYRAHPRITAGPHGGKFYIDYMVGDSENGLNIQRSNHHAVTVVGEKSPAFLKVTMKDQAIQLKWKPPVNNHNLMGYYIYRNGIRVNDALISDNFHHDNNPPQGTLEYTVLPVYIDGSFGTKCVAKSICFTPCGNGMMFDGIDDKVMVFDDPTLHLSSTLTLEAWINLNDADVQDPRIISKGEEGTGYELLLSDLKIDKSLDFRLPFGSIKSSTPIYPGQWYHVAAVYDGKLLKLFINGKPDCQKIVSGTMTNSFYPLIIGKSSTINAFYFNGTIDEVRVWNKDRSNAQILESFSSRVSPEDDGLVGNWSMSEGCTNITCDLSMEGNDGYLSGSCWCPNVFPFVENVHTATNPGLVIPVMNYTNDIKSYQQINMEFKVNPKLLQFQGIIVENTQLEGYTLKTKYSSDGTIKVIATNPNNTPMKGNTLLYVDVKALNSHIKTNLIFAECIADGQRMRVASGEIIATAVPFTYKTGLADELAMATLFNIYPNPASTYLKVELGEIAGMAEVRVIDVTGQEVHRCNIQQNESKTIHEIDLLEFSKGIYLINLRINKKVYAKKFVIN